MEIVPETIGKYLAALAKLEKEKLEFLKALYEQGAKQIGTATETILKEELKKRRVVFDKVGSIIPSSFASALTPPNNLGEAARKVQELACPPGVRC